METIRNEATYDGGTGTEDCLLRTIYMFSKTLKTKVVRRATDQSS